MAAQDRLETSDTVLPLGLRLFLRNRVLEIAGLGLLALIGLVTVALATWQAADPSFNHAVDTTPSNALGLPGAYVSDQLMQWFGLAAIVVVAIPLAWAVQLLAHRPIGHTGRQLAAWFGASAAAAALLSFAPAPSGWPLGAACGGALGELLGDGVQTILGLLLHAWIARSVTLVLFAAGFLAALSIALDTGHLPALHRSNEPAPARKAWRPTVASILRYVGRLLWQAARLAWRGVLAGIAALRERLAERHEDQLRAAAGERMEPRLDYAALPDEMPQPETYSGALAPVVDDSDADREYAETDEDGLDALPGPRITPAAKPVKQGKRLAKDSQLSFLAKPEAFELPALTLLAEPKHKGRTTDLSEEALTNNARMLEGVLDDFGVRGEIIHVRPGPVVTLYELQPAPGIKSSRVIGLADDIARSMSAISCRVAVIPGRNVIGIELPNAHRETVYLRELLGSTVYERSSQSLCLALGKNIGGEPVFADLARMPHLLIAGTTGSGKSVGINTMILSILYKLPPERCRLIMIDPKMLELSVYEGIPHLLAPVVTDPKKAVVALKWAVREMEERYRKMSKLGVRNIDGFNARIEQAIAKGSSVTRTVQTGFDPETGEPIFEKEALDLKPMPYIVVIIDEMADLMMVAGKEIEGAVQRLAQMARAAGIHVIMATQRPSVDVITGTIKANFPTRISFQVTSKIDSRTILGEQGAEQLLGQGDMLWMAGGGRISRLHGPFVSDDEVEKIVRHLKDQGAPDYVDSVTEDDEEFGGPSGGGASEGGGSGDDLYDQAVAVILRDKKVSTSYVQRRLQIGYNKAASLIERMEKEGLISAPNATGRREILVPTGAGHD
ncbi:MAG: DNA translocase FtsK [Hyphomicrobiales bacterium]